MTAGTRRRRPQKNGVDGLPRRQRLGVELCASGVEHRSLAAELAVPDVELPGKVAKAAHGRQVEPLIQSGAAQIQKRRHDLRVQETRRIRNSGYMRARLAGQFAIVHEAMPRAEANSATWSNTRAKIPTSWAPEIVY